VKTPFLLTQEGSKIINIYYNNSHIKGLSPNLPFEPTIVGKRGCTVGVSRGSRAFPKGKVQASTKKGKSQSKAAINSINPRRAGNARLDAGRKLSISCSILVRSAPKLAGSIGRTISYRLVFFSDFISHFFLVPLFESPSKIMLM